MVSRLALAGLAIIFATGAWLVAAPFVLRYQPAGRRGPARPGWTSPSGRRWLRPGWPASSRRSRARSGNCTPRPARARSRSRVLDS